MTLLLDIIIVIFLREGYLLRIESSNNEEVTIF